MPAVNRVLKGWESSKLLSIGLTLLPGMSAGISHLTPLGPGQANALCFPDSFPELRNLLPTCLYPPNIALYGMALRRWGFIPSLQGTERKLKSSRTKAYMEALACEPAQAQ